MGRYLSVTMQKQFNKMATDMERSYQLFIFRFVQDIEFYRLSRSDLLILLTLNERSGPLSVVGSENLGLFAPKPSPPLVLSPQRRFDPCRFAPLVIWPPSRFSPLVVSPLVYLKRNASENLQSLHLINRVRYLSFCKQEPALWLNKANICNTDQPVYRRLWTTHMMFTSEIAWYLLFLYHRNRF